MWTRAEQSLKVENLIGSLCLQLSEEPENSSLDLHQAASTLKILLSPVLRQSEGERDYCCRPLELPTDFGCYGLFQALKSILSSSRIDSYPGIIRGIFCLAVTVNSPGTVPHEIAPI